MTWQTIDSAPVDGTRVILSNGQYVGIGRKSPNIGDGTQWTLETEHLDIAGKDAVEGFWAVMPVQWQPLPIPDPQYIGAQDKNPNPRNPSLRSGDDGK